jgi:acyl-[acyl carrier protein]--UDP-N-acetylglucosamine O-acyltransferase
MTTTYSTIGSRAAMNWSTHVAMNCLIRLFVVLSGQTAQAGTVAAACYRSEVWPGG